MSTSRKASNFGQNARARARRNRRAKPGAIADISADVLLRVKGHKERLDSARLRNLSALPELRRGLEVLGMPKENPLKLTTRDGNRFVGFRDEQGDKLYVDLARAHADREDPSDPGELVFAAIERGTELTDGDDGGMPKILLREFDSDGDGARWEQAAALIRRVLGPDAEIVPVPAARTRAPRLGRRVARRADADVARDDDAAGGDPTAVVVATPSLAAFRGHLGPPSRNLRRDADGKSKREVLEDALGAYHDEVGRYDTELRRLAVAGASPHDQQRAADELEGAIAAKLDTLGTAAADYQGGLGLMSARPKKEAVALVVETVAEDRAALHTRLRPAREAMLLRAFAPLVEEQVDANAGRIVLGIGSNGEVTASTYVGHGRDDLPARFTAAVKMDGGGASSQAEAAGVPSDDPQQSNRAVASYLVARALGMTVVPPTAFVVRRDASGELVLGHALEVVSGTDGQLDVTQTLPPGIVFDEGTKTFTGTDGQALPGVVRNDAGAWVEDGDPPVGGVDVMNTADLINYMNTTESRHRDPGSWEIGYGEKVSDDELRGRFWKREARPGDPDAPPDLVIFRTRQVEIDYRQAVVQKELADLQVLDNIIGHPDRNASNYRFRTAPRAGDADAWEVTGVRALDNEDAFGRDWSAQFKDPSNHVRPIQGNSVTPGLPEIVDFHTALAILKATPDDFADAQGLLADADRGPLILRFLDVRAKLADKIRDGRFAALAQITLGQRRAMRRELGLSFEDGARVLPDDRRPSWSDPATYRDNTEAAPGVVDEDSPLIGYVGAAAFRLQNGDKTAPAFRSFD